MCGIAGFYGFKNDDLINKFSKELENRGPDGEGFYIDEKVTLLNRRLAIIDREGGDQPIYNEDKSIIIVFVGEIYNYQEQTKELVKLGHKFRTKSDTEVVVHAYEQWGVKSFDRHNGMFVFALYDKKKEKLLLVRDHFGIKPLYYSILDSIPTVKIVFSSEIKPLIYSGLVKKKPNDRIIYRYLKYRIHDNQKETFFEGVNRLMPGEYITVKNSELRIKNYTNLKNELLSSNNPEGWQARNLQNLQKGQVKEFKKKLIEAIRLRLISEVPVGSCLSGGLDSSTVVAVVNKLLKEKIKEAKSVGKIQNTFSAVFPDESNNEEKYIDEVLKSVKLESHKVYPKPEEFFKEMEDFVRTQEEPTISTGPYAQYKVMQEAHKYVTVLLDGQGADEMLGGYEPYNFFYLMQLWYEKKYFLYFKEFVCAFPIIAHAAIGQLAEIFGFRKSVKIDELLNPHYKNSYKAEKFKIEVFNLKKRLIEDIFSNSLPALLRYEDKNAMRFSIEGRVPFLDFNLLRYLFSLPDEALIKNSWNKNILRQVIKGLVPEKIRLRKNKIGFTTPEYQWFLRMKNKIYSIFLSESFAERKYFNQSEVLKAFQEFIEGKNDDTMLFWRLMNIELWMRIFFDAKPVTELHGYRVTSFGKANAGKKVEINVEGKEYLRYPIRTELFKRRDNVVNKINESVIKFLSQVNSSSSETSSSDIHFRKNFITSSFFKNKFFLIVSEKIVAIAQGRSYFIWDIKTGFWAKLLSRFVKKTPYGIGLGSPWTMQLAITEIGLPRMLFASLISLITKPFGIKGMFYRIAGGDINAIDGPTEYSLYPSNVSAKLGPKEPEKVANGIHNFLISNFQFPISKQASNFKKLISNFLGVVIIDANDLGQNVLGNSTGLENKLIEKIFKDNPMGQSDEQTPLVLVVRKN
ncbi:asparagine synthase (glutamine-hydrolyzing) [Candidatus Roizmanbacteria bacterium RIFCSPHIGHO2_01_FULL_35_10]|uniref:asparagine synthase (glutamine-hydrolyzing) n=1 Tax=Candidatus Roizmanbacteria bacterium RIFCSPLOWO2_01_FULL_35_13 TaxID=1802055 RepID=A0A1F7IHE7_9BACT|nr:MAG: asparagine synthase (glutamine-hydrolyzing) [Candidatus Roizmanbacteria bacterium RIFCSPHIGHO2_01_FULL_35_10]OGK42794.1 MAG: asparagine synthase (glutamine-hydrolyzing) [Candidatus Roizmanbacteria bacterium RIFCSPLOWO2_01_FULL_35_13]